MKQLDWITEPLLEWFYKEKRDLPWRHTKDSYKIWISEIMLQQTRVEAVIPYYERFIEKLPTIEDLAHVEEDVLLKLWEGLGYYTRARNLKKCAQKVLEAGLTKLPEDYQELRKLPGIGDYTAGSIASIAYNKKTPAVDGNVLRVMTRLLLDDRDILNSKIKKDYFEQLQKIMPEQAGDFTESLMELGALVCLPNGMPHCEKCPLSKHCLAHIKKKQLEYPKKEKKITRKVQEKTVLLFIHENKVAIHKREEGLLEGLYEYPNLEGFLTIDELKKRYPSSLISPLKESSHIFSHIKWNMKGYQIIVKEKPEGPFLWVEKEELFKNYSIPTAFHSYTDYLKK